jgi:hypothetical protein
MRYWKLKESRRVIAVRSECEMSHIRWQEICEKCFDRLRKEYHE